MSQIETFIAVIGKFKIIYFKFVYIFRKMNAVSICYLNKYLYGSHSFDYKYLFNFKSMNEETWVKYFLMILYFYQALLEVVGKSYLRCFYHYIKII